MIKKRRLPRGRGGPMSPLRKYRRAHGLSVADMSVLLGCNASTLSLVERGLSPPRKWLAEAILDLCGDRIKAEDLALYKFFPKLRVNGSQHPSEFKPNWDPPQDVIDEMMRQSHIEDLVCAYRHKLERELPR